jgi:uncharacterized protein YndB with AHSA1/START domain
MPEPTGTYAEVDGRPTVRFQRTFPHPIADVWDAITDPARLAAWFPTSVEFAALAPGEPITFRFADDQYPVLTGVFQAVEPPARLVFTWSDDVLTFELAATDGGAGCRLSFTVALDSAGKAARDAAGWDDRLDILEDVCAGHTPPVPFSRARWEEYYAAYQQRGLPATAEVPQ